MTTTFIIKVKSQGRIVIPSNVRLAEQIRPDDWVVIRIQKRETKEA